MTDRQRKLVGALLLVCGSIVALWIWQIEKPGSLIWDDGFKYVKVNSQMNQDFSDQLPADKGQIKSVTIKSLRSDIKVIKGKTFQVSSFSNSDKQSVTITYANGGLKIEDLRDGQPWLGIGILNRSRQLVITIPETQALTLLAISNQNGDILLDKMSIQEKLQLKNVNGDLIVSNSDVQTLTASNQNGDISFNTSQLKQTGEIVNQNGDILIKSSQLPSFHVKKGWGDLDLSDVYLSSQTSQVAAKCQIINQNGDITLN